ncbi:MAG: mannitol dehydrogenase family protein [Parvibaculaceae bacterium]
MPVRLSIANLESLKDKVDVPGYERSALKPGIVHFGVGNFHRAHQAIYLDDLFNLGDSLDWAIIGAGVLPSDEIMREKLASQDYLTTVVEQEAHRNAARVTGPMVDFVPPADRSRLRRTLADPAIRIVSLTVTEGGYFIDSATGEFNERDPAIRRDAGHPDTPATVFGLIVQALADRRRAGIPPFTVMCCDNIPHNGRVTRRTVTGLARLIDPALASWITDNVAFPNAMVDRITPATGDAEREFVRKEFAIEDQWPVLCEEFKQWVMEDKFPTGRPDLHKVGVQFVPDVTPYELTKLRILNGGHAAIAYPAGLLDVQLVHEAIEHRLIAAFLHKLEHEEIIPHVPVVPEMSREDYLALVVRRFSNPKIKDTIRRIALDGSNRQPKFILPVVADRLAAGKEVKGLALVGASWARYCAGKTDSGAEIAPNDPNWERLQAFARKAEHDPEAFLAMDEIFGPIAKDRRYVGAFVEAYRLLKSRGTKEALATYIG